MTHDCLPLRLGAFDRVHEGTKCRWAPHSSSHLCTPEKFDRGAEAAVTMRNPDFCYELDDFMLSSPSHQPTHHSDTLRSYACAIHGACACLDSMASHRCSSVFFRSEVSKKNFDGIVLGASLYLGAVRARHVKPSSRSPSFAQLEQPGLEGLRQLA